MEVALTGCTIRRASDMNRNASGGCGQNDQELFPGLLHHLHFLCSAARLGAVTAPSRRLEGAWRRDAGRYSQGVDAYATLFLETL